MEATVTPFGKCAHSTAVITKEMCISLSSIIPRNRMCIRSGCNSSYRICPVCITQGEVERAIKDNDFVKLDDGLCGFHKMFGETTRRRDHPNYLIELGLVARLAKVNKDKKAKKETVMETPPPKMEEKEIVAEAVTESSPELAKEENGESVLIPEKLGEEFKVDEDTAGQIDVPRLKVIGYITVNPAEVRRFVGQPRKYFIEEDENQLCSSIRLGGQKQPIQVKIVEDDPNYKYELVDGERRWRAAKKAGLKEMAALLVEVKDEKEQFLNAVVANYGNKEPFDIEAAFALGKIKKDFGYSHQKIAKIISKPLSWVNTRLRLLKLYPEVLELLNPTLAEKDRLALSIALELTYVTDENEQKELAGIIIRRRHKINKAKRLIWEKLNELGIAKPTRKRKPSDELVLLRSFIDRTLENAVLYLEKDDIDFDRMFENRPMFFIKEVRQTMERIIEFLEKGVKKIKKFEKI